VLRERFDLVAVVAGDDEDSGALCERRHDLAGEAEDGGGITTMNFCAFVVPRARRLGRSHSL
jgi:hypothetical protein